MQLPWLRINHVADQRFRRLGPAALLKCVDDDNPRPPGRPQTLPKHPSPPLPHIVGRRIVSSLRAAWDDEIGRALQGLDMEGGMLAILMLIAYGVCTYLIVGL